MALRILANENVPGEAIDALRLLGHDVVWVRTQAPGSPDEAVLAQAQAENRIVVTFDKDFGELAFRQGLPATCGVILFRTTTHSPSQTTARILAALQSGLEWTGYFSVVENDSIRMNPMEIK
jgi:predicted nuclease of predicted toxin-antitoxin system